MPRLVLIEGHSEQRTFELKQGATSIGRTSENDITVRSERLSRHHARLDLKGSSAVLRDLGSRNGTFVDGIKITHRELQGGETIRCANISFRYQSGAEPPPRANIKTLQREDHSDVTRLSMVELLGGQGEESRSALKIEPLLDTDRSRQKLRILLKVGQLLSSPMELDQLLEKILELVLQILEVDRAAILMLSEDSGKLETRVSRRRSGIRLSSRIHSESIVNYVRDTGEAALFSDAAEDERLDDAQSVHELSIRASMCAPLLPKQELLGVLYVDNLSVANSFEEDDLEFLVAFANHASVALENSMLLRKLEDEAVAHARMLRFFPPATIGRIMQEGESRLEAIEAEVTVLFCDITSFVSMTSQMTPHQIVELLNAYFPLMADIVFRHEGTLEKYIGDALLAFWGAPFGHPEDAERAVRAAAEMQRAMAGFNQRRSGEPDFHIHIGMNTGRVAAGNIGSEHYIQYATIGETTNLASRICNVAQAGEIVIGQSTLARLAEGRWPVEELEPTMVKGKEEPLRVYRLRWDQIDPDPRTPGLSTDPPA